MCSDGRSGPVAWWRKGAAALALAGVACSPTFNWRDVAPEGVALKAQLPCKPDKAERVVPLTPEGSTLVLWSCDAGDLSFALAWARLPPAASAEVVLERWRLAGWASLGWPVAPGAPPPSAWRPMPLQLPLAQGLQAWQGPGQDHQGRQIEARQAYFAHAGVVYQAAVYGPRWSPEAQAFFDALSLRAQP
jgi:hypothetical protein